MSGAELKNIVNEAAIFAVRANAKETGHSHFEGALRSRSARSFLTA
jgi:ATP-dependent Zn protease